MIGNQVLDTVELVGCLQGGLLLPPYPRWHHSIPVEHQQNHHLLTLMNRKVFGASVIWLPPTSSSKYGKVLVCGGTSWMEVSVQAPFHALQCLQYFLSVMPDKNYFLLIILRGPPFIHVSIRWQVLATLGHPCRLPPGNLSLPWQPDEHLLTWWKWMEEFLQWEDLMAHCLLLPSGRWEELELSIQSCKLYHLLKAT